MKTKLFFIALIVTFMLKVSSNLNQGVENDIKVCTQNLLADNEPEKEDEDEGEGEETAQQQSIIVIIGTIFSVA